MVRTEDGCRISALFLRYTSVLAASETVGRNPWENSNDEQDRPGQAHNDPQAFSDSRSSAQQRRLTRAVSTQRSKHLTCSSHISPSNFALDSSAGIMRVAITLLVAILSRTCGFALAAPPPLNPPPTSTPTSASQLDGANEFAALPVPRP